jgi:MFS family permease
MFGRGLGDTYAVFLLPLEREFGWTRSELTSVYSIYLLVNGCTAPLVGLTFDRLGPRWVYGAGMASLGAAFFFASGLTALWQFYLFIGVLVGIGVSMNGMVPASALLGRWYRDRLSSAIGIAYSAFGAGTVLFVPLVQYLVGEFGWRASYRVMGWVLLALAPVVVLGLPWRAFAAGHPATRSHARQKEGGGWTLTTAVRAPVFWGLVIFACTAACSPIGAARRLRRRRRIPPLTAATAFGVVGLLSAASVIGSGFASIALAGNCDHELRGDSDRDGVAALADLSFVGRAASSVHPGLRAMHGSARTDRVVGLGPLFRRPTRGDDLRPHLCQQCCRRCHRLIRGRPAARPDGRVSRRPRHGARADRARCVAVLDRAGAQEFPLSRDFSVRETAPARYRAFSLPDQARPRAIRPLLFWDSSRPRRS